MRFLIKPAVSIVIVILLITVGFIYLLRGCLSKYDERSALSPSLYFERANEHVLFSIVRFDKTISYSRQGGFINKSISTTYYLQTNDAISGKKLVEEKIINQREIRNHPVEIIAGAGQIAWVFIGEPMAFNPYTLEKLADLKTLKAMNPRMVNLLPAERRFYQFDFDNKIIRITARDGSFWWLDPITMLITPENAVTNEGKSALEALIEQNRIAIDSAYEQKFRRPARQYARHEISTATYNKVVNGFNEQRERLFRVRDSLQALVSQANHKKRNLDDLTRSLANLRTQRSTSFNDMKVNMDSVNDRWYGLYSGQEITQLYDHFEYRVAYDDPSRRQLYRSNYHIDRDGIAIIDKGTVALTSASNFFLNGGFLLDNNTGRPIHCQDPEGFLITFRDQVGDEGKIQLSRTDAEGNVLWTINTQLKRWSKWIYTSRLLIVFGLDNKALSGDAVNMLRCIDLSTGKASGYDFFNDR